MSIYCFFVQSLNDVHDGDSKINKDRTGVLFDSLLLFL